jgi:RHS repeat-associated protein
VKLEYDRSARLAEAIDTAGRRIVFEHDGRGRLRKVWLPAADGEGVQLQAELVYSDAGDLVEVRDAAGHATRYAYANHVLVSETDRNGVAFHFRYDGFGPRARCVETWGVDPAAPSGAIYHHVLDYDRRNRRTIVTSSLGAATVYAYDGAFMVVEVVDALGRKTTYERDHAHRVVAEIDPLGHRTVRGWDERGELARLEQPGGRVTEIRRDDHGRVIGERSPAGAERARTWDRFGRLVAEVDPAGHRTEYLYEDGHWVGVIDAAGQRTAIEHDDAGNVSAVTTPDGAVWRWVHDALGRVVEEKDPTGAVWRWGYDALGRAVRVETPDGNVVERMLDPEGHVIRERDRTCDVTMTRRGTGWLASYAVGGATVSFEHDAEGRWVAVTDAAGRRHVRELDPVGAVRREIGFDGASTLFERDALGRVTRVIRSSGRATAVRWGAAGLVESIEHDGGPMLTYGWSEDGALVRAACDDVVVELERDPLGRVLREACGAATVASSWDHHGLRSRIVSSRGAACEVERNTVGDPRRVVVRDASRRWEAAFTHDGCGREIDRRLPGGARGYWWRDGAGRPTQHFVGVEGGAHRLRRWSWAAGDRLLRIDDAGEVVALEHDARGRLVAATRGAAVQGRHRDDAGNVFGDPAGSDRVYAGAVLQSSGGVVYRHDPDGRRIAREHPDGRVWRYHWDGAGRLVQVDRPNGSTVAFAYDAFGRRVWRNAAGRVTRWQWDGDVPLHEWSEEGEPVPPREPAAEASRRAARLAAKALLLRTRGEAGDAQWMAGLEADAGRDLVAARLLAEHSRPSSPPAAPGEAITWAFEPETFAPLLRVGETTGARAIVCDSLGSPSCLVDDTGAIVWTADVDVYGRVPAEPTACPFRFAGQYEDPEVELFYNRHRWYDPEIGAYLSPDPIGLRGGLAPYAYVADPLVQVDPLGLGGCIPAAPEIDLQSPISFPEPPDTHAPTIAAPRTPGRTRSTKREPHGLSPGIDAAVGGA